MGPAQPRQVSAADTPPQAAAGEARSRACAGEASPANRSRRARPASPLVIAAIACVSLGLVAAVVAGWLVLECPRTLSRAAFRLADGTPCRAQVVGRRLEGGFGDYLEVHPGGGQPAPPGPQAVFRGLEGKRPWKVCAGDFDGDGRADLLVGVYKTTPFDRNLAPRPFVYDVEGTGGRLLVTPKWLGSRLPGPFADLAAGDVDGDGRAELVALMLARKGLAYVASYGWNGFGFEGEALSATFEAPGGASPARPGRAGLYVRGDTVVLPGIGGFGAGAAAPGEPPGEETGPWPGVLEGPRPLAE